MEKYFERLKSKLLEIYQAKDLDADYIYNMIISESEGKNIKSNFSEDLNNLCLYLYYKENDLQALTKSELPFNIEKGLDFKDFCEWLNKYKLYYSFSELIKDDNYYDLISRALSNRGKVIESFDWKSFQKDRLENKTSTTSPNFSYKIYLPIANDSLEYFALRLLGKCVGKNIDYDFKINNNPNISRSDNVVVYASDENFNDYINVINSILENGNITLNESQQHLLAFPYSKGISVAPYIDNGKESFSSIVCNRIFELKNSSSSFEDFYSQVTSMMNDYYKKLSSNGNFEVTSRDIVEASYDADTNLCVEANNSVQNMKRSRKDDDYDR